MTGASGSGPFCFRLKRRKSNSTVTNTMSARPPSTHPTMMPSLLLDDEVWAVVDSGVLLVPTIPPVEDPEFEKVALSGTSALG